METNGQTKNKTGEKKMTNLEIIANEINNHPVNVLKTATKMVLLDAFDFISIAEILATRGIITDTAEIGEVYDTGLVTAFTDTHYISNLGECTTGISL